MGERFELLVCPLCGHRWLTIGAAALSEPEAQALVADHLKREHGASPVALEQFVPAKPPRKPRPPSRRSRG